MNDCYDIEKLWEEKTVTVKIKTNQSLLFP